MKTIKLSKYADAIMIHVSPSAPKEWTRGHNTESVIVTEIKALTDEQKKERNNQPLLVLRTSDAIFATPDELIHIGRILQKIGQEKKNGVF